MRYKYKHPISTIGTIFFFAGIFTPLPFMMGFGLAIICWIIGKQFEDEYNRNRVINPIISNIEHSGAEKIHSNKSGFIDTEPVNKQTLNRSQFCVMCGNKYSLEFDFCNNCGRKSEYRLRVNV